MDRFIGSVYYTPYGESDCGALGTLVFWIVIVNSVKILVKS